jgi:very-short-patch-repair endonuclease
MSEKNKKKVKYILARTKKSLLKPNNPIKKIKYLKAQSIKMDKNKTWPEKEFESILKEMKITYETQKILGGKIFDYYLPDTNTLCEVDGDYYHANDEKYKKEDLNEMQKRNIKNDKYKNTIAIGMNYDIFRVWESELKKDRKAVIQRIKKEILS